MRNKPDENINQTTSNAITFLVRNSTSQVLLIYSRVFPAPPNNVCISSYSLPYTTCMNIALRIWTVTVFCLNIKESSGSQGVAATRTENRVISRAPVQ